MRALLLLMMVAVTGCGHAAAGAQARALEAGALWTGPTAVLSLAVGRVNKSGDEVLWLAHEKAVVELADDGVANEVWRPPKFARVVRMEAMDLDGDGGAEWVVTIDGVRIRSVVLSHDGEQWVETANRTGFLRPLMGPDGEPWLLAQSVGAEQSYSGPITRMTLSGGRLAAGETVDVPRTLSLHDIFYVPTAEGHRLFAFEPSGHLSERDPRSPRAQLWRADARTVSRPVQVDRRVGNLLGEEVEETLELPVPPVVTDLDGDGSHEVLVVAGVTTPVAVLENVRVLQGGDARVMKPGVRGLEESHRSLLLGRAMVGAVPFVLRDGTSVLAAAVWTRSDTGFVRPESRVFLLDPATGDLLNRSAPKEPSAEPVEELLP